MSAQIKTLSCIYHLVRIYYSLERFDTHAPAMKWLLDEQLIVEDGSWWTCTDRARVYVEAIRDVTVSGAVHGMENAYVTSNPQVWTICPDFLRGNSDHLPAGQYVLYSEYLRLRKLLADAEAAIRELATPDETKVHHKCMADMYADPPRDCNAPYCGCNPAWDQCIEMLQECGWKSPNELPRGFVWVPQCACCSVLDLNGARHRKTCAAFPDELVRPAQKTPAEPGT